MGREQAAMWEHQGKVRDEGTHEDTDIKDGMTCIMESFAVTDRQALKCYLECHLADKDGGEDVVGDSEEDSFLDRQTEAGRWGQQSERGDVVIRGGPALLTAPLR